MGAAGYERAFAKFSRDEAIKIIRKHDGWSVPFQEPEQALVHPQSQLYASAFVDNVNITARLPWRINDEPLGSHHPKQAPAVGADTKKVLSLLKEEPAVSGRGLPLRGIRVANFGVGGVAPWASSLLAQLGATVVKIEAPNEFIMYTLPPWRGLTTTYAALNANVHSVKLNLKRDADR